MGGKNFGGTNFGPLKSLGPVHTGSELFRSAVYRSRNRYGKGLRSHGIGTDLFRSGPKIGPLKKVIQ